MQCKYCGGEVNLSVGRCVGCGRFVDDTADVRILHDLGSLAEKYGLDPDSEKYSVPEERPVEQPQVMEQRTSAETMPRDVKAAFSPGIELQTYYQLLGDEEPPSADPAEETADEENPAAENSDSEETSAEPEKTQGMDAVRQKVEELLDKVDAVTTPVTERVRQWYNAKMPELNRAKSSSKWERLAVVGIIIAAAAVLVVIISMIVSSIPTSVNGEWRVSDEDAINMFTVEFSGGEVTARVYGEDGEAHIYKKGTYDTSRRNGRNLLTIEYEDGSLSHLYYEITGRAGEFVNVDTGSSDTYLRVG